MNKRRWFQLHLSTLLAVTFAAGGLLYANVVHSTTGNRSIGNGDRVIEREARFGWPLCYVVEWQCFYLSGDSPFAYHPPEPPNYWNAAVNAAAGAGLLGALAYGLELFARRKRRHSDS